MGGRWAGWGRSAGLAGGDKAIDGVVWVTLGGEVDVARGPPHLGGGKVGGEGPGPELCDVGGADLEGEWRPVLRGEATGRPGGGWPGEGEGQGQEPAGRGGGIAHGNLSGPPAAPGADRLDGCTTPGKGGSPQPAEAMPRVVFPRGVVQQRVEVGAKGGRGGCEGALWQSVKGSSQSGEEGGPGGGPGPRWD